MAKKTKSEAKYGPGHPNSRCGKCKWFEPPSGCEIVEGRIEPDMWCKFFHAKSGGAIHGPELLKRHDDRRREMDKARGY